MNFIYNQRLLTNFGKVDRNPSWKVCCRQRRASNTVRKTTNESLKIADYSYCATLLNWWIPHQMRTIGLCATSSNRVCTPERRPVIFFSPSVPMETNFMRQSYSMIPYTHVHSLKYISTILLSNKGAAIKFQFEIWAPAVHTWTHRSMENVTQAWPTIESHRICPLVLRELMDCM